VPDQLPRRHEAGYILGLALPGRLHPREVAHAPHAAPHARRAHLLAVAGTLAAGCGGGGGSSSGGSTTTSAGGQGGGNAVTIDNLAFSPTTLNVKTGQQVTWTNKQDIAHTVTADGGAFDHQMPPGATFSFTFAKAGSFPYHCNIHPSMTATVQVS
jgi:plastocyanin